MVVGIPRVHPVTRIAELRVGNDPVFRKQTCGNYRSARNRRAALNIETFIGAPQYGAGFSGHRRRDSKRRSSVERVQRIRKVYEIAIGKIGSERRTVAHLLGPKHRRSIDHGRIGSPCQSQPHEDLVEQRNIFSAPGPLERVEQCRVVEDVGGIDVDGAQQARAVSTDIPHVQVNLARQIPVERQREILNVGRLEIGLVGVNRLSCLEKRNRLHRLNRWSNRDQRGKILRAEVRTTQRPVADRLIQKTRVGEYVVAVVPQSSRTLIRHLDSAANRGRDLPLASVLDGHKRTFAQRHRTGQLSRRNPFHRHAAAVRNYAHPCIFNSGRARDGT